MHTLATCRETWRLLINELQSRYRSHPSNTRTSILDRACNCRGFTIRVPHFFRTIVDEAGSSLSPIDSARNRLLHSASTTIFHERHGVPLVHYSLAIILKVSRSLRNQLVNRLLSSFISLSIRLGFHSKISLISAVSKQIRPS